jgi:hypothetical protein
VIYFYRNLRPNPDNSFRPYRNFVVVWTFISHSVLMAVLMYMYPCPLIKSLFIYLLGSAVGIVTRLRAGCSTVWIQAGTGGFALLPNIQTSSGLDLASYSLGTGILYWGSSAWGVKLTTHFHLVLRGYTSAPPESFHGVDRNKFLFLFCPT